MMLDLPFFDAHHRELVDRLERFVAEQIEPHATDADSGDPGQAGRQFIAAFAAAELLSLLVPADEGGAQTNGATPDLRALCLARETIAASSALADAVFAVQGLGSFPIVLAGSAAIKQHYLPRVSRGTAIAAFALTEPSAGSDISAIQTTARRDGDRYVLDGVKTLISNAGIADFYVVFARSPEQMAPANKPPISAFVVDAGAQGLRVTRNIQLMAPHPIGDIVLDGCRIPAGHRLGADGDGFKLALATLDFFRATVGAAACGLAGRALREARAYASVRQQFGTVLSEFQATKFALADMAVELDAARLLVYRAAWLKDRGAPRVTREASMAKLFATEAAQRIVDRALQIHGGIGVQRGVVVERLYREVRALRIYEGTSEIQRLIIADQVLKQE